MIHLFRINKIHQNNNITWNSTTAAHEWKGFYMVDDLIPLFLKTWVLIGERRCRWGAGTGHSAQGFIRRIHVKMLTRMSISIRLGVK